MPVPSPRRRRRTSIALAAAALAAAGVLVPPAAEASAALVLATVGSSPSASGWYSGTQQVTLSVEADSLDSGTWTATAPDGSRRTGSLDLGETAVTVSAEGTSTVAWAVTTDGRTSRGSISLKVDGSDPRIELTSASDGAELDRGSEHALTFRCTDAVSGIASCLESGGGTSPVRLDTRTPGARTATVTAVDGAGRSTTRRISYSVFAPDTTAPLVTNEVLSGTPGKHGWYVTPVVVRSSAVDPTRPFERRSGIGARSLVVDGVSTTPTEPSVDVRLDADGRHHQVTASARDVAGNDNGSRTLPLAIDTTAPSIVVSYPAEGQHLDARTVEDARLSCHDATSGVQECRDSGIEATPGPHTLVVEAEDAAGNTATQEVDYVVDAPSAVRIDRARVRSRRAGVVTVSVTGRVPVAGVVTVFAGKRRIGSWESAPPRGSSGTTLKVAVPVSRVKAGKRRITAVYGGTDGALPSRSTPRTVRVR